AGTDVARGAPGRRHRHGRGGDVPAARPDGPVPRVRRAGVGRGAAADGVRARFADRRDGLSRPAPPPTVVGGRRRPARAGSLPAMPGPSLTTATAPHARGRPAWAVRPTPTVLATASVAERAAPLVGRIADLPAPAVPSRRTDRSERSPPWDCSTESPSWSP